MLSLVAAPIRAQRRRPPAQKTQPTTQSVQPAVSLDTLLAADSYKIYGEVRGVGQLLRSAGVSDVLDPMMKLAAPPKEFKTLVSWLNSQADALMTSRLMFAAWPSRPKLPQMLFAIEFASAEEAQKFEPQLRGFLPKFLPAPTPESSPRPSEGKAETADAKPKETSQPPPQYILKQAGALVLISDTPFTLKNLRPTGSKLFAEDENFRQVHNRFNSESVFLYFDVASVEKEEQEQIRRMEEEEKKQQESEAANPPKAEADGDPSVSQMTPNAPPEGLPSSAPVVVDPPQATLGVSPNQSSHDQKGIVVSTSESAQSAPSLHFPSLLLSGAFFGGPVKWPEAIGIAITFESDSYVARALLVNRPEAKGNAIPFIPQLVHGPAVAPEASSILPADTELLVIASLDYPLMYEGLLNSISRESEAMRRGTRQNIKDSQSESPFASYETKLGIKIKEDLLPLLGNEIAVSIPVRVLGIGAPQPSPSPVTEEPPGETRQTPAPPPSGPQPVIAIAVRDKEAVRTLIPKIIDSLGFKGASLVARTEKRDDTEIVSYANVVSYAFVGNFLVASPDTKVVSHVVDSYLNHHTLASDGNFKNYTRWQPRQLLGQVYISSALMEAYAGNTKDANSSMNEKVRDYLSRLSPTAEPLTYALSEEGLGPLHELHVPKNLVMLLIAGIAGESNQPPLASNEAIAKSALRMVANAEMTYQSTKGDGNFATLDQLLDQGLVQKDLLEKFGYKIELTVLGAKFEATALPTEYGKTGKMSFFVDESAVVRGGDRGGAPATIVDKPVQ